VVGGECSQKCDVPCIGDGSQICGGDWTLNVYQRKDIKTPLDISCTANATIATATTTTGCEIGNCTQYNFTEAWTFNGGLNWSAPSVLIPPGNTDPCSTPCKVLEYYPYFIWQMHENLRAKIADRLKVDWPSQIAGIVGDTCSCEIGDIEERISMCGGGEFGLDGVAEGWICDLVGVVGRL
jgi:hypothetical protein